MNNNILLGLNTAGVISLLIGTVLPLVVGYFTKQSLNAAIKAGILAALSAVTSVLTQWGDAINNNQHFLWQTAVAGALVTWVTGELTYLKIWKPSTIAAKVQNSGNTDNTTLDLNYPANITSPPSATDLQDIPDPTQP